jgi:hypothetical protein
LLDELREMTDGLTGLRLAEPPPEVLQRAAALLPGHSWVGRTIRLVRAALTTDSATLAALPVRSYNETGEADAVRSRYLRFEAEGCVAELHTTRTADGRNDLAGRLLQPVDQAPFAVIARDSRGYGHPRVSDELGHFHFPSLPPDCYELWVELDDADLLLAPLALD